MIKSQAFAITANVVIIGNVISVVRNASRITENVLIPIVTRWGIFRRDRMDKFESCDDCIYSDVGESVCIQMQCIHAFALNGGLRERYIPKADARGTSHWIPRHINSECAKCGGRGAGAFKFCPWCGRRMTDE